MAVFKNEFRASWWQRRRDLVNVYSLHLFRLLVQPQQKRWRINHSHRNYVRAFICSMCGECAHCSKCMVHTCWSDVKMREFQSWFIVWYKVPCIAFNRSIDVLFANAKPFSIKHSHAHAQMPLTATATTANSFSPANFPAIHRVIHHHFVHVKHRYTQSRCVLYFSFQVIENAHFHVQCVAVPSARKLNFDRQTACTLKLISKTCAYWMASSSIYPPPQSSLLKG